MSFIGTLDQLDLSLVLQRIEENDKTGLLVVRQDERAVELSFRHGQLLCIGPVKPGVSLGKRLLQAGIISPEALQEVSSALGADLNGETGMALALIDLGYINQESLYRWAMMEASQVLEVLLSWADGELHFHEEQQPPTDRLLIALSVASLLTLLTPRETPQPASLSGSFPPVQSASPATSTARSIMATVSNTPATRDETGFRSDAAPAKSDQAPTFSAMSLFTTPAAGLAEERDTDAFAPPIACSITPPQRATGSIPLPRVNTAYLQPSMVLVPTELAAYRAENPRVQLTPEQWRLFTRADGQTTLQEAAQGLAMSREQVCQVAAELVALSLVTLSAPMIGPVNELSPLSRDYVQAGLANGFITPGAAAAPVQPWDAVMPALDHTNHYNARPPIETLSQWGNGGNGATFVLGNGWVVNSPPAQPSQPLYPPASSPTRDRIFAKAG